MENVIGKIVVRPAVFDCHCCKNKKYFEEVLIYLSSHESHERQIHLWEVVEDNESIDTIYLIDGQNVNLHKVF